MTVAETWIVGTALAACLYMAWNMGANDVANAMGTSVGSRALTLRRALILAAVFEFAGAFLVGSPVTDTMARGIVRPSFFEGQALVLALGMLSALVAASLFLHAATFLGLPVSTTHAIVGALAGFGVVAGGAEAVRWDRLGQVVLSWVVSPVFGGVLAYALFALVRRTVLTTWNPVRAARRVAPFLVFPVFLVLILSVLYQGLPALRLDLALGPAVALACGGGLLATLGAGLILERRLRNRARRRKDAFRQVEGLFAVLQVGTACSVAFAHGANDVANAVGPFAAVLTATRGGDGAAAGGAPAWLLAMGGAGIVVGLATWGYRVIETVGRQITTITPSRGFAAEFATAATVLACTKLGLPVSTSHTLVGAVVGVGLAKGVAALNLTVVRHIVTSWLLTVPFSALVTAAVFVTLREVLL